MRERPRRASRSSPAHSFFIAALLSLPRAAIAAAGPAQTFQATLFADGGVRFSYQTMDPVHWNRWDRFGETESVGYEDRTGSAGAQISLGAIPASGTSYYVPPACTDTCPAGTAALAGQCAGCRAGSFAAPGSACVDCIAGQADTDGDAATPCEECGPGEFSSTGAAACTGCAPRLHQSALTHTSGPDHRRVIWSILIAKAPRRPRHQAR